MCSIPPESAQVRRAVFSDDGKALLSGGDESFRTWGWEPVRAYEGAEVRWSRLTDMCVTAAPAGEPLLLGASVREAMVSVWSIDLSTFRPFSAESADPAVPIADVS